MSKDITKRKPTQFQPGKSGNPRGRPKGSKNKATLLKEAMQHKADLMLTRDVPKVLKTVLQAAIAGDMQAAKMILDRAVPVGGNGGPSDNAKSVQIVIKNLTAPEHATEVSGITIDGEKV